jgi:hypothetical protein
MVIVMNILPILFAAGDSLCIAAPQAAKTALPRDNFAFDGMTTAGVWCIGRHGNGKKSRQPASKEW